MKMVTDMERIGDHAADISEITISPEVSNINILPDVEEVVEPDVEAVIEPDVEVVIP